MSALLRVLIVDDQVVMRQAIAEALKGLPGVEVVARAADGDEALRMCETLLPDLVTLDLEMPKLDGFSLLRVLLTRRPTPVIVVSSASQAENMLRALDLGALDFVAKATSREDEARMRAELRAKVAAVGALRPMPRALGSGMVRARSSTLPPPSSPPRPSFAPRGAEAPSARPPRRLVVIAASMGGPPAVRELVTALPRATGLSVVVALHMPARYTRSYAERLAQRAQVPCAEGEEGALVASGTAWIAPGGRVTEVTLDGRSVPVLRVLTPGAEDRFLPSADRLFSSAASAYGPRVLAIVLSGMGRDGVAGIEAVHASGGEVWVEASSSAVADGMPAAARATGLADLVLPHAMMSARLATL